MTDSSENPLNHTIAVDFFSMDDESTVEDEAIVENESTVENEATVEQLSISLHGKEAYLEFLIKNAARIEEVTIYTNMEEDEADEAYLFLGRCLAILPHVKTLHIIAPSPDGYEETYSNFNGLGEALNQLQNPENLSSLLIDITYLDEKRATEETFNAFLHFLNKCIQVEDFRLEALHLNNTDFLCQVIQIITKYPKLISARVDLGFYRLEELGYLFTNKSLEELYIHPIGLPSPSSTPLSLEEKMKRFASGLGICTNLKKLTLDFSDSGLDENEQEKFSIKMLEHISHNKTLTDFTFEPLTVNDTKEMKKFIHNFKNSSLTTMKLQRPGIAPTLLRLIESITQENKKFNRELAKYKKSIGNPAYFPGSFFQYASREELHQLDSRLHQIDLRIAHKHHQESGVCKDIELYQYFCTLLMLKNPTIRGTNNMIHILSYLDEKDFSKMLQVCTLETLAYARDNVAYKSTYLRNR